MSTALLLPAPAGIEPELPSLRSTLVMAAVTVAALLVGTVGWSLWAHLDSAVVTEGFFVADSRRKTVQHLEGGILRGLLVHEGDRVGAGDIVALLDTTQAEAVHDQLNDQLAIAKARRARLEAERDDRRELRATGEPGLSADLLKIQQALIVTRWNVHDGKVAVLKKRILQLESTIAAAEAQLEAADRQLALFNEERQSVDYLLKRGIERRPRMMEIERNIAAQQGRKQELIQQIAANREAIAEARLGIDNLLYERRAEIADELDKSRLQIGELENRLRSAKDVLERREIRAPQTGIVADIRLVTPGGVIGAGQPLLDIVPEDDRLLVEARISPSAIDNVHPGLPVQVRLTAYKRSIVPLVDGRVTFFSADMLADPRTGEGYFLARIEIPPEAVAALPGIKLSPGMPAEAMIVTGERRAFEYFLDPLLQHLRRAFREE